MGQIGIDVMQLLPDRLEILRGNLVERLPFEDVSHEVFDPFFVPLARGGVPAVQAVELIH